MNEFAVRFQVNPAPEQRGDVVLETRGPRKAILAATNMSAKAPHTGNVVSGAQLDVSIDAKDLDDALEAALAVAEEYIIEMSVLSASRCGLPQPCIAVNVDTSVAAHAFRQYVQLPDQVSRRFLTAVQVPSLRGKLAGQSCDITRAIRRGMHAYREAMSATDPLVEFLTLWVGVEALNPALGRVRGAKSSGVLEGTRGFFETHVEHGASLYRRAHKLRNEFVHGSREATKMSGEAEELLGQMRVACRDAIAATIGERWGGDRRPLKNWPVFFVLETTLNAPIGTALGLGGDLPHFRFGELDVLELKRVGDRVAFVNFLKVMEQRFAAGVEWGPTGTVWLLGEQVELTRVEFDVAGGENEARRSP